MCFNSQSLNFNQIKTEYEDHKKTCCSSSSDKLSKEILAEMGRGHNKTLCNKFYTQIELLKSFCSHFDGV